MYSGWRVSSTFEYHASITDLLSNDINIFQIEVNDSNVSISVAPYLLTYWMVMGKESCMILKSMLRNTSYLCFGLIFDLGLK